MKPATLSGGEKQRVAIARALILEPSLLLFDEPLTGLDEALRLQMRDAIVEIQERLGIAAVYVTHHPEEALSMARRVAVLDRGRLLQHGSPREVFERPAGRRAASILGPACFLGGTRTGPNAVETAAGPVSIADGGPGGNVLLVIRPRTVRADGRGKVRGRVRRSFFEGGGWRVLVDLAGEDLVMESSVELPEGEDVALSFDPPPAVVERET
jgi:ABC-type Fe3+/spermidine/putrescine transport system ATPase subunit